MSGACFQYLNGRLVQTWTSRTGPTTPDRISSTPGAEAQGGRPLVAHLGGDLPLDGGLAHQAGLVRRVGQRLLAVDVLPHPHRHQGGGGVGVVGGADHHGVDLWTHLFEQLPEVAVRLRVGKRLGLLPEALAIDVAKGHDVAQPADVVGVARPLAADADAREPQPVIGRTTLRARD